MEEDGKISGGKKRSLSVEVAEKDKQPKKWTQKRKEPNEEGHTNVVKSGGTPIINPKYLEMPIELQGVDLTKPIRWKKHPDYLINDKIRDDFETIPVVLTPIGTTPIFTDQSPHLCFHLHATHGYARAATVHLPHGPVATPVFMPVGTKGTVKALTVPELLHPLSDVNKWLGHEIILCNTYHLAAHPTTELLDDITSGGGIHHFMAWPNNVLTDSGGFQMVSLLKLAHITEDGVEFQHPDTGSKMMLRPEDSIQHQINIGSDIVMMLDDVVSSISDSSPRFQEATYRTLRWLDRCYSTIQKSQESNELGEKRKRQNLFPIVQGGLDTKVGGLREQCLAGFRHRDADMGYNFAGYAIGGLAGGESKEDFWRVVHQCCRSLPDDRPRYLMGVGYPLDLVVCTALGVDMYDCVYPTRTARFGVALVSGPAPGTLRLRTQPDGEEKDRQVIERGCQCQACSYGYTRGRLRDLFKANNPLAAQLLSHHNVQYMRRLNRRMKAAIMDRRYDIFCKEFLADQFPASTHKVPLWVKDALNAAGISLEDGTFQFATT
jgi:tRNA-guanine transglycosylase